MIQGGAQMFDVEGGVMRNHEVGAGQPGQKFRRNGGKFRGIQNIQMRQAVTFNEVFVKPAVAFGWPHQPIRSLRQLPSSKTASPAAQMLTREGLAVSKSMLTKFMVCGKPLHASNHRMLYKYSTVAHPDGSVGGGSGSSSAYLQSMSSM
jgi:hypothetical protein